MSIFRAYDIRGLYGKDLTEEVMLKLGKSLGTLIKGDKICVGYDSRASSKSLFEALTSGLMSAGCQVVSIGLAANPMLYYYSWKNKMYGVLITASHNSKEWNGLKMVRPNGASFIEEIVEMESIYDFGEFKSGKGSITSVDGVKEYENFMLNNFSGLSGKIVAECFGASGALGLPIIRKLGLDVVGLGEKLDSNFYGVDRPEPREDNLIMLKKSVLENSADFGVAYDGDADRAVFVDNKGRMANPSSIISIIVKSILAKKSGSILLTADCASEIEKLTKDLGGKTIWWRIGHGFVEQKSLDEKVLFAGEQSSHFYFNEFYPFSDGILASVYIAKILNESGEKLSEMLDKVKIRPIEKLYIKVRDDEEKLNIMQRLRKKFPDALDIVDGIKMKLGEHEWVLLRASQTNPEINLCVEAENGDMMKELVKEYTNIIKSV